MLRVYAYQGCSTCRNARKWLQAKGIAFEEIAIRDTPPGLKELKAMLQAKNGELRSLFNTSGQDYRALGIKDKLASMGPSEALQLLAANGNLVKRPFALDQARGVYVVGFREDEWATALQD